MKISILTLFPEVMTPYLETSILKRAKLKGAVKIEVKQIRDFTKDKYGRVDTPPIGGGAGLIEKIQPIVDALRSVKTSDSHVIFFSPRGKTFTQQMAKDLAKKDHLILISGHYEGVDERLKNYIDEEISIGDYVLTGGELPCLVVTDAVTRLLPGVINEESLKEESFNEPLLEYPQYTEPYDFEGHTVPDILYCGNHEAIAKYRRREALKITKEYRPDLFNKIKLTKKDIKLLEEKEPSWEKMALEKGKKYLPKKDN